MVKLTNPCNSEYKGIKEWVLSTDKINYPYWCNPELKGKEVNISYSDGSSMGHLICEERSTPSLDPTFMKIAEIFIIIIIL